MENKETFEKAELVLKYLRQELTSAEEARLRIWLEEDERNGAFLESLTDEATIEECLNFFSSVDTSAALQRTLLQIQTRQQTQSPRRGLFVRIGRWKAAAAILLVLAGLAVLWRQYAGKTPVNRTTVLQPPQMDIFPGGDKATLLLADGSMIRLDHAGEGTLKEGDGIRISQQDGEVIYEFTGKQPANAGQQEAWNTISTPRGGQYQLKLPDGSKVWLNAGSDLRFPAAFTGSARVVELKGEAYFEVARYKKQPFRVSVNGLTVEVLGTHFNVKAYEDEQVVQTTLVEGKVKVKTRSGEELLLPGKQASMDRSTGELLVKAVNTENVMAWKNGLFRFSNESIDEVMKKIARWYNIEVTYQDVRPEAKFNGMISRDVPLSQVLEMLEMTGGARFRMHGRSVTVRK